MKILKPGETIQFHCDACGCEFVAGKKEVVDCGFFMRIDCPQCGCEVHDKKPERRENDDARPEAN